MKIHKATKDFKITVIGRITWCGINLFYEPQVSRNWKKVTCKNCLKMKEDLK